MGDFKIELERSGGLAGISSRTSLEADQLSDAERLQMEELLDRIDFDRLAGEMAAPSGADRFQYDLALDRAGKRSQLTCYDGSLPAELKALIDSVMARSR